MSRVATVALSTRDMSSLILRYRKILVAITRVELAKRYAGSVFGMFWVILNPALLLFIYLFIYLVVFRVRFPGLSSFEYVLFVFAGLVPYLGFMEATTTGTLAIKQNIHLVKNVMLPIELIPVRVVLVSMVSQFVSMGVLLMLITFNGYLSLHIFWLPLVVILQIMMLIGLVWVLSSVAMVLPDVGYFLNLAVLFLMFVSPIGYKPEMVPDGLEFMIYLNPISYMVQMYRDSMLYGQWPNPFVAFVYVVMCVGCFVLGGTFFRKFKDVLVDYE